MMSYFFKSNNIESIEPGVKMNIFLSKIVTWLNVR